MAQGGLSALSALMGAMQPDDMTLKGLSGAASAHQFGLQRACSALWPT